MSVLCSQEKIRKRNRGELSPTPVKELALSLNIPVLTPSKMKDEALIERLKSENADFFCGGGVWKDFTEGYS